MDSTRLAKRVCMRSDLSIPTFREYRGPQAQDWMVKDEDSFRKWYIAKYHQGELLLDQNCECMSKYLPHSVFVSLPVKTRQMVLRALLLFHIIRDNTEWSEYGYQRVEGTKLSIISWY